MCQKIETANVNVPLNVPNDVHGVRPFSPVLQLLPDCERRRKEECTEPDLEPISPITCYGNSSKKLGRFPTDTNLLN